MSRCPSFVAMVQATDMGTATTRFISGGWTDRGSGGAFTRQKCVPRRPRFRRHFLDADILDLFGTAVAEDSVASKHQKDVQDLEADRRHGEEIDRHHGLDVIVE